MFYLKKDKSIYNIIHINGAEMGDLVPLEDGDYVWLPPPSVMGCISLPFFKFISKELEKLNATTN